jgi:hypothetical protein
MQLQPDVQNYDELSIALRTGPDGLTSVRLEYVTSLPDLSKAKPGVWEKAKKAGHSAYEQLTRRIDRTCPDPLPGSQDMPPSPGDQVGNGKADVSDFKLSLNPELVRQALDSISSVAQPYVMRSMTSEVLDPIRTMGRALFSGLFEGRRQRIYGRSREMAESRRRGLRLRLLIDDPELAKLPWEFLHDGTDFINLSARSPVVRMPLACSRLEPLSGVDQLSVLFVTVADSSGNDLAEPYIDTLYSLKKIFPQLGLEIIRKATPEQFFNAVQGGRFEVVTYLGWDSSYSKGQQELNFMGEGFSHVIPNPRLKMTLGEKAELRLMFLCAGNTDLLAGELATIVPAAIGIRGFITDPAAQAFTQGLFTGILQGQPLETAVTWGRFQIDTAIPGSREWGLPVFHLSAPHGTLFDFKPPEEAAPEQEALQPADSSEEPPADVQIQAEWKKFQILLTIKRKNMQSLQEKKAGFGSAAPEHIESQIAQTDAEIADLENKIKKLI